jgi:3-hydroxyacyl-CoA dehydrogenase/enoyl-CoA hydratase/3-hydroxybutyryl-CoA epimerase
VVHISASEATSLVVDVDGDGVATIRRRAAAVLNPRTIGELAAAVAFVLDSSHVKGAVVTGCGTEFLGGLDLEWLLDVTSDGGGRDDDQLLDDVLRLNAVLRSIETAPKPIAAAIDGRALGVPLEIALACQRRFAAGGAGVELGLTGIKIGLPPMAGGALRLAAALGAENAAKLVSNGQTLTATAALEAGIVDELTPAALLVDSARAWVLQAASDRNRRPARDAVAAVLPNEPSESSLRSAAQQFAQVARGTAARSMVRTIGIGVERVNDLVHRPAGYPRSSFAKTGVLGAGLMGGGIALVAALAGLDVVLLDVSQEAAERGLDRLRRDVQRSVAAGRVEQDAGSAALARIVPTDRYEALRDVDIVIEAVFEDRLVKAEATQRAEAVIPARALFATNTSTLPISGLAQVSLRPEQFIGLHFFSPVPRMPLLEIIRGERTSDATLAAAMDFAQTIGKTPIVVRDARGFYTTRVVMAYQAESYDMLAQGIAPALVEAGGVAAGMPVPPLALSDAVGLDLVHQINLQSRADLGERYRETPGYEMIGRLVETLGRTGKKSGRGFYDYGEDGSKQLWSGLQAFCASDERPSSIDDVRDRLLAAQALETARCIEERVITDPLEADVGAILGWGFAPWTGGPLSYIDGLGVAAFVARCDALADRYGSDRLRPPASLRELARDGATIYGKSRAS